MRLVWRVVGVLAFALLWFWWATAALASDQPMTFRYMAPEDRLHALALGTAWTIYADGVIGTNTPKQAEQLIEQLHIPPWSVVYLNSPGGNLFSGMELGRVFRKHEFYTDVGVHSGPKSYDNSPGICMSACTLAYLGGKFRYLVKGSTYGVHRFFLSGADNDSVGSADALAVGQIFSAAIMDYIREMGADPALLNEMTKAGETEINILSSARLEQLGVVNNGTGKTVWTIESLGNPTPVMYLKGERDTQFGLNKFMIYCDGVKKVLHVVFDPQGRAGEVTTMHAISLMLDNDTIKIGDHVVAGPVDSNGWINTLFELNKQLIDRLLAAKSVGVVFQYSYEAPFFLGFQGMDFTDGRAKLEGLLSRCK